MTKRLLVSILAAAALAAPLTAQQHRHGQQGHQGRVQGMAGMETAWKELNAFHALLHASHEPVMRAGDLTAARATAASLAEAADTWAKSTAPAECKAPADIGEKLAALVTEARAYAKLAADQVADDQLKAGLDRVHDRFRTAHRGCMPMGGMPKGPPADSAPPAR